MLTATCSDSCIENSKNQKSWYYPAPHCLNVNVLLDQSAPYLAERISSPTWSPTTIFLAIGLGVLILWGVEFCHFPISRLSPWTQCWRYCAACDVTSLIEIEDRWKVGIHRYVKFYIITKFQTVGACVYDMWSLMQQQRQRQFVDCSTAVLMMMICTHWHQRHTSVNNNHSAQLLCVCVTAACQPPAVITV